MWSFNEFITLELRWYVVLGGYCSFKLVYSYFIKFFLMLLSVFFMRVIVFGKNFWVCRFIKIIKIVIIALRIVFLCSAKTQGKVWKFEIWNLKFVFILKWVNSLNRYHNQSLLKLLTVSFCFLTFVIYLVIVKFIIYSILACNFYIGNCTVF